ncbi:AbrB/MazE/SpoVT family DNA-binding domain-containing protein [Paenibacillus pasadenensis]|uniref:AbrB/MazE/SpoVT family DNA-binding domain-containing protein n=1 Tax=Paenibacillus pasadenensis TaxID=217090 RepID=UPI0005BD2B3C|nr:AbrB/MazE/SpoVT family DNA-binding domain-containing protein [Paenibacillus pasadenensis]
MAKVSTKGQITFPSRWMKLMNILPGDQLFFHIQNADQSVRMSTDRGHSDLIAKLSSTNVITVPSRIRKWLDIKPGDDLEFSYDENQDVVYFKKRQTLLSCPICCERGLIGEQPCFVCQETGIIEQEHWKKELTRLIMKCGHYDISISILGQDPLEILTNNAPTKLFLPRILLTSPHYSTSTLAIVQDYYQGKIIREAFVNGTIDARIHKSEVMSMLLTVEEKNSLEAWLN